MVDSATRVCEECGNPMTIGKRECQRCGNPTWTWRQGVVEFDS